MGQKTTEVELSKITKVGNVYYGVNFLSYNYVADDVQGDQQKTTSDNVSQKVSDVRYFSDATLWDGDAPVDVDNKNAFIVTDAQQWTDDMIKVGDYVHNITYYNNVGDTSQHHLIPGLAKIVKKQFIKVNTDSTVNYLGTTYKYLGQTSQAINGNIGFYLFTASAPVLIETDEQTKENVIIRQLPITSDEVSYSLRFIPLKGLQLTSRHRPGYDENGNLDIEGGIEKIYSVLTDEGIHRGLTDINMVSFRYIVDSMSYGIGTSLGGKVYLSQIAMDRGETTALLNLPSQRQFAVSQNPYFCKTFEPSNEIRPSFDTKYIPQGGNTEMGTDALFSLPTEDEGSKFTACFFPHLMYTENGKTFPVPPAADVCNVLNRKFTGVMDMYAINANQNGILQNKYITGVEYSADKYDRDNLEPFGVNTIIKDGTQVMIYGNQTAYQDMKSDFNKLHVRENFNTAELACRAVTKRYVFLYNNASTRASLVSQLTPILSSMQTSGALDSYEIICDESNNTSEIIENDICVVDINVVFNHGMEKIVMNFTANRLTSE